MFFEIRRFVCNLPRHFLAENSSHPLYAVLQTFPSGSRRFAPTLSRQSSAGFPLFEKNGS